MEQRRIKAETTCPTCNGARRVRSPQSIAVEHARKTGVRYEPGESGPWTDYVDCPRCKTTGFVDGGYVNWPPPEPWRERLAVLAREVLALANELGVEVDPDVNRIAAE